MSQLNSLNKIKDGYLLYVGNAHPHKNLERLVEAFQIVLIKEPKLKLVLIGKIDYFYEKLRRKIKETELKDKIIFTGEVSTGRLKWWYENSLVYVFPSLAEGFGLPGLEAMAAGLPVVCSNQGPLPEIYESAAVYFNPFQPKEMAEKILEVLNNPLLREKLINLGRVQVRKYSWQKCAQQTLEIYKKI